MKNTTITELIGKTPLLELEYFSPNPNVRIFAKLESRNPAGSVKDRLAYYLIKDAEEKHLLSRDKIIVEATSGNTGIGLAMISAKKGYKFLAVMPESASIERRKIMKMYGADIKLTDGEKGTNYSIEVVQKMVRNEPEKFINLNQFENPANPQAHYETTGREIIKSLPEVTHFVAGMGTGGTLMGTGKRLKGFNSNIKVIGVEPNAGSKIQGLRNMAAYTPSIFNKAKLDGVLNIIDDEAAFDLSKALFKKEGISVGISAGAALWGAIQVAYRIQQGNIVTIFPDSGDKYLSTKLFN